MPKASLIPALCGTAAVASALIAYKCRGRPVTSAAMRRMRLLYFGLEEAINTHGLPFVEQIMLGRMSWGAWLKYKLFGSIPRAEEMDQNEFVLFHEVSEVINARRVLMNDDALKLGGGKKPLELLIALPRELRVPLTVRIALELRREFGADSGESTERSKRRMLFHRLKGEGCESLTNSDRQRVTVLALGLSRLPTFDELLFGRDEMADPDFLFA